MTATPQLKVGIIGDYDGRPTQLATEQALKHSALARGLALNLSWLTTATLLDADGLTDFDSLFCAPGSPYLSMEGALCAIQQAREAGIPFIGTCGGFQHVVLEYARNVLGLKDADHEEYDPNASNLLITALRCSPFGQTMQVRIVPTSKTFTYYGREIVQEEYRCMFGLAKAHQARLDTGGLRVVATDQQGEARIVELPQHPFFVAALFVPQLRSSPETPHPLISAFLLAALSSQRAKIATLETST